MRPINILIIGSGGREHALAWKIKQSPLCKRLFCAPGNAGIANVAECVPIDALGLARLVEFVRAERIDLVVIGPEAPLAVGLTDALAVTDAKVFGPSKAAARLESSKGFLKDLCARENIPTARYARFKERSPAIAYLAEHQAPYVIKADGLAAGKGVVIAATRSEAESAIRAMLSGEIDGAGEGLVIEEFLEGEEVSFFALSDGENALALEPAQDHKRAFDGDRGPNTGGMGAYSPAPVFTDALREQTMAGIIRPTIAAMTRSGTPFRGVLFAGLMITRSGPKLIEYNVRFGDPECQVLMMRLKSDLVPVLLAVADGALSDHQLEWRNEAALAVVIAAEGYPGTVRKGSVIRGLEALDTGPELQVFHAATARNASGELTANGGRVLNVAALGETVAEARALAYQAVDRIDWPEGFCRRDIGWRALSRP